MWLKHPLAKQNTVFVTTWTVPPTNALTNINNAQVPHVVFCTNAKVAWYNTRSSILTSIGTTLSRTQRSWSLTGRWYRGRLLSWGWIEDWGGRRSDRFVVWGRSRSDRYIIRAWCGKWRSFCLGGGRACWFNLDWRGRWYNNWKKSEITQLLKIQIRWRFGIFFFVWNDFCPMDFVEDKSLAFGFLLGINCLILTYIAIVVKWFIS